MRGHDAYRGNQASSRSRNDASVARLWSLFGRMLVVRPLPLTRMEQACAQVLVSPFAFFTFGFTPVLHRVRKYRVEL
jgi:hypothetical protein